jgi:hypothetical protein
MVKAIPSGPAVGNPAALIRSAAGTVMCSSSLLHLIGHAVHGVRASHHEVSAAPLEALGSDDYLGGGVVPASGMLQRLNLTEVGRPHQTAGRAQFA